MILNDLSLVGQFTDEEFYEALLHEIKPVLEKLDEKGLELFKNPESYSRLATPEKTMWDMISVSGDAIASIIKQLLTNVLAQEPFLSVDGCGDDVYVGEIGKTVSGNTCLFGAIVNSDTLLSFPKSEYSSLRFLSCKMGGKDYRVRNVNNKNECLLWLMSDMSLSDFGEAFSEWQYEEKALTYTSTDVFERDMKVVCQSFEDKDYNSILEHLSDLERVILSGKVTRFSHPLIPEEKVYEYRLSLSNGNELRMTYSNTSPICFLTAFVKKSENTPKHEKERAKKQLSLNPLNRMTRVSKTL